MNMLGKDYSTGHNNKTVPQENSQESLKKF